MENSLLIYDAHKVKIKEKKFANAKRKIEKVWSLYNFPWIKTDYINFKAQKNFIVHN